MLFSSFKSRKQAFLVFGTAFLLLLIPLTTFSINNLREGRSKASEERIIPLNLESKTAHLLVKFDSKSKQLVLAEKNIFSSAPSRKESTVYTGANSYKAVVKDSSGKIRFETALKIPNLKKDFLFDLQVPYTSNSTFSISDSNGQIVVEEKLK